MDPTAAADQPLTDSSDAVWVVLNGAIYNAPELRRRYSNYPFRSRSDVETVLPLFLERGPAGVAELDGMFALALYDTRQRMLLLARDRAGEKPLYYWRHGNEVWFASELQALLTPQPARRDLDPAAVRDFVTLGYVTEPKTMFQGCKRVRSGTCLTFSTSATTERCYWDPTAISGEEAPAREPVTHLESLLCTAVRKQLVADVPVGIFTSGGVDSALLAAMASDSSGPASPRTFSIGFPELQFDETEHARNLAQHLGTRHSTVMADEPALTKALHFLVDNLAEPSADPAILPTYLLACAARDHVTVVLGGEGADELFGGYPTYLGHRITPAYRRLPKLARRAIERFVACLPASLESKVSLEYLIRRFLDGVDLPHWNRHMRWFGTGAGESVLSPGLLQEYYEPPVFPDRADVIEAACVFDYQTYLRDNLLAKVDRATMLASIEARAPFLDPDVTRFAFALDSNLKVKGVTTKWLMKQVARRWLPRRFVFRKKRGLSVPVATWLNGSLGPEVDRLLSRRRIERQGLLHPGKVCQLLKEHRSRRSNHGRALWTILMLQYWLERWLPERGK